MRRCRCLCQQEQLLKVRRRPFTVCFFIVQSLSSVEFMQELQDNWIIWMMTYFKFCDNQGKIGAELSRLWRGIKNQIQVQHHPFILEEKAVKHQHIWLKTTKKSANLGFFLKPIWCNSQAEFTVKTEALKEGTNCMRRTRPSHYFKEV